LFLERSQPPSEKEQIDVYTQAAKKFDVRPVTIRLADLGGDKVPQSAAGAEREENPFMGCRGVRFLLKYPEMMRAQLRAIIRTAAQTDAKIKVLVPMVSAVEEIKAVKEAFTEELKACEVLNCRPRQKIDFGIMIEVPSVAVAIDTVLDEVDFISIGSNDLIQYIVAVDRVNQEVASLYNPYHPAVLRLIGYVIQSAKKKNREVSLCGELASDPEVVPLLIGLGLENFSASARMFLRIKNKIRSLSYDLCSSLAQAALLMTSAEEIKKLSLNVSDENS
jgi:phosphotransferase system enzyme I (PtsI)